MSDNAEVLPVPPGTIEKEKRDSSGVTRILRYTVVRLVTLFLTVVVGIYITILIANMGGYVDEIRRGEIRENVTQRVILDPVMRALSPEVRTERINSLIRLEEKRLGLDQPFIVRSFAFLKDAITLNLGRAEFLTSDAGSKQVRLILLERLPSTLVLFATQYLILFTASIFFALFLSRRYGSIFDKIIVAMAPTSAAPGWFYGIFLILIFAAVLKVLPFGGMVDAPPPEEPLAYAGSMLKHMILPVSSLMISGFFFTVYNYRTFFLIYSSEDYVEMAKAKGLNSRDIERRYILRPTLPTIITNFALAIIGLWQGGPIIETVFNWPGLGRTLFRAIGLTDTPVIVGSAVLFAYLLAVTVFLLDFIYVLVDPRVKIGSEGQKA